MQDDAFLALQPIAVIGLLRPAGDMGQIIARLAFGLSERQLAPACNESRQNFLLLGLTVAPGNELSTQTDASQIGLDYKPVAYCFHDRHQVYRVSSKAPNLARKRQAQQTHFGKRGPDLLTIALVGLDDRLASGKGIFFGQKLPNALGQQLLFFAVVEIHATVSCLPIRFTARGTP